MPPLPVLNNRPRLAHEHPRPDTGGISGSGGAIADPQREQIAVALNDLLTTGSGPDGRGGEVRFGLHDRLLYSTDASLYQVEPLGVVVPASIEDAGRAIEFCAARGLAILPRGGGTSLAGQCTNRAVVIVFSVHCWAVLSVDVPGRRARVEPGVTIDELNERLTPHGLFFAPDPATSRHANIGGCIGNNAAGARSILYGRTSENVASIDGALADG